MAVLVLQPECAADGVRFMGEFFTVGRGEIHVVASDDVSIVGGLEINKRWMRHMFLPLRH